MAIFYPQAIRFAANQDHKLPVDVSFNPLLVEMRNLLASTCNNGGPTTPESVLRLTADDNKEIYAARLRFKCLFPPFREGS